MGANDRNGLDLDLLTTEEVAGLVKLHPQTVYRKARAGKIPSVMIDGSRRYRRADIARWIDEQRQANGG